MPRLAAPPPALADVAPPELLDEMLAASHAPDPYPVYRRLARDWPVWRHLGVVGLMRYDDIASVLRHPQVSTDDRRSAQHAELRAQRSLAPQYLSQLDRRSMLHRDPPEHTRLRRLAATAFTPRRVEALRPVVQRLVDRRLDGAAGRMDFVTDLAHPLPIDVTCRLLGIPPEDRAVVDSWPRVQLCCSFEPADQLDPGEPGHLDTDRVQQQLGDYFGHLIERRRAEPGDDLVSALLAAEHDGMRLRTDEVNSMLRLLFVAGYETTVNLIGNGLLALLRHPEQLRAVRRDQRLAAAAVEETLRYDAPFQFTRRVALADLDISSHRIPQGSTLLLWLAAANRDPAHFDEPDRFDITRTGTRHLGFGTGIHACLGGPLARMQGEICFATVARRLDDPRLAVDPPPYRTDVYRAIETLPVTFG